MMETTNETVRNVLTSTVGKWIAGLFAVVLAPVLPALINFVNNTLGYELTDAQVQSYSKTASLAIAGVVVTWLLNRGLFERKALDAAADPLNSVDPDAVSSEVTEDDFESEDEDPDGSEHVNEDDIFLPEDDPDREGTDESLPTEGFGDDPTEPAIEDEGEPPVKGAPLGDVDDELPDEEGAR